MCFIRESKIKFGLEREYFLPDGAPPEEAGVETMVLYSMPAFRTLHIFAGDPQCCESRGYGVD